MLPMFFFISILSSLMLTHSYSHCLDDQKTTLLQLKDELYFDDYVSTKLVQWNQTDACCNWYGVECDAAGNIISLELDGEGLTGLIGDSSSLFRLKYLEKLNLAYNNFVSIRIPRGIRNLTYLTHLNLSNAGFGGQVPAEILSLTRLVSLDISNVNADLAVKPMKLEYPNLEMLVRNLTGLRELYLDYVKITSSVERRKWSHIISSYLPNLTSLSLSYCDLSGPLSNSFWQLRSLSVLRLDSNHLSLQVLDLFANFSSLSTLTLVECGLEGTFPNMIFHMPTLQKLDLSFNHGLSGTIPPFNQTGPLKYIRVKSTNFSGLIPTSIGNLKNLSVIDLSYCRFTGSIPSTLANLTKLIRVDFSFNFFTGSLPSMLFVGLSNLFYLDLEYNSFHGNIPSSLFGLPSLVQLWLNNNQFDGVVEEFVIANVSNIVKLDLSGNRLKGPIPESFFQLQSLQFLFLFGNLFDGTFQLDKIQTLAYLFLLDLSGNNLSVVMGNTSLNSHELPRLETLGLASCNMYEFPEFINHVDMRMLDLSNNHIAGEIPNWVWGRHLQFLNLSHNLLTDLQKPYHIPDSLELLDLHSNEFMGELHLPIPPASRLGFLSMAINSLSGSIPTSLCSAKYLVILDLSVNSLSGTIPPCLLENITALDLGGNNISGCIPDNFPSYCMLEYINISNNTLGGKIPKSLKSCKQLEVMNIGNNIIHDTFPCMLSSTLKVLVLRSNRFHGEVRCHKIWPDLQIVDISSNNFSGSLESMNFSSWRAMMLDNGEQLRYNLLISNPLQVTTYYRVQVRLNIKGTEINLIKIWPDFTAIDFSFNKFQGGIPNAIGNLSSLHLLNFSHNALNGSIPKLFGQLRVLESLDLSRNQLMGEIPVELAGLTFLAILNLSYNKLVGGIPHGPQFQTFPADSFIGNPGLCGFSLNISCYGLSDDNHLSPLEHENEEEDREIEWEYVFAALGYVVGLGCIVWLLFFRPSFREKYFGKVEEIVERIFDGRDRRRRCARRLARNRVGRQ